MSSLEPVSLHPPAQSKGLRHRHGKHVWVLGCKCVSVSVSVMPYLFECLSLPYWWRLMQKLLLAWFFDLWSRHLDPYTGSCMVIGISPHSAGWCYKYSATLSYTVVTRRLGRTKGRQAGFSHIVDIWSPRSQLCGHVPSKSRDRIYKSKPLKQTQLKIHNDYI